MCSERPAACASMSTSNELLFAIGKSVERADALTLITTLCNNPGNCLTLFRVPGFMRDMSSSVPTKNALTMLMHFSSCPDLVVPLCTEPE